MPSGPEHELLTADGREIAISNPRKILFPQAGYTKLDLARYYERVGDWILPHLVGRVLSLVRAPSGVKEKTSTSVRI